MHRKKPFSGMDVETHRTAVCVQGVRPPLDKKLAPADLVALLQVWNLSLMFASPGLKSMYPSPRFSTGNFTAPCNLPIQPQLCLSSLDLQLSACHATLCMRAGVLECRCRPPSPFSAPGPGARLDAGNGRTGSCQTSGLRRWLPEAALPVVWEVVVVVVVLRWSTEEKWVEICACSICRNGRHYESFMVYDSAAVPVPNSNSN